jgi:hypothetical protein
MVVKFAGRLIVVRLEQLENKPLSKTVTPLGIEIDWRLVHPLKIPTLE